MKLKCKKCGQFFNVEKRNEKLVEKYKTKQLKFAHNAEIKTTQNAVIF